MSKVIDLPGLQEMLFQEFVEEYDLCSYKEYSITVCWDPGRDKDIVVAIFEDKELGNYVETMWLMLKDEYIQNNEMSELQRRAYGYQRQALKCRQRPEGRVLTPLKLDIT